jgi:cell division control protein 24
LVSQVINTVTAIVDHLPQDAFEEAPPSPPSLSAHDSSDSLHELPPLPPPANARESRRIHITREIIETERKYVEGLEVMQVSPQLLLRRTVPS